MKFAFLLSVVGIAAGLLVVLDSLRSSVMKPRFSITSETRSRSIRALLIGIVVGVVTGWAVGFIAGAALGWWLTELMGGNVARKSEIAKTEAIASWTEMLRDTLSGAHGLEETIIASANVAPKPIEREVVTLGASLHHQPLEKCLRQFAADLSHPSGDLVVAALLLAATGSTRQLGDLLGTLAEAARDECSMRLRIDAARSRMRTAVRVITGCTLVTVFGLVLFNRSYLEIYGDALGQCVLALIAVSWAISLRWLSRMGTFITPERFLAGSVGGSR